MHSEVLHTLTESLRSDCSTAPDNIPVKFIKLVDEYLAGPIIAIGNSCIENSIFPSAWKTASISPISISQHPKTISGLYLSSLHS